MNASDRSRQRYTRLARLFPRAWRARYEPEFLALIEDRPPGPRDLLDILVSALDARVRPQAWAIERHAEGLVMQSAAGTPGPTVPPPGSRITVGGRAPSRDAARDEQERRFSRREFLRNAVLGGAGLAAAVTAGGAIVFARPNKTGIFGKEVLVPQEAIPAVGAPPYKHLPGKFWLINNTDGALALYWKCPHLGCTVPWAEDEGRFHCPCHKSIYDRNGVRIEGPAPRPMDLMALRVDDAGNVIVHTGEITKRHGYDPAQAVRIPEV
jgi:cytochrome b6-f complex iron-sulfur subunit